MKVLFQWKIVQMNTIVKTLTTIVTNLNTYYNQNIFKQWYTTNTSSSSKRQCRLIFIINTDTRLQIEQQYYITLYKFISTCK